MLFYSIKYTCEEYYTSSFGAVEGNVFPCFNLNICASGYLKTFIFFEWINIRLSAHNYHMRLGTHTHLRLSHFLLYIQFPNSCASPAPFEIECPAYLGIRGIWIPSVDLIAKVFIQVNIFIYNHNQKRDSHLIKFDSNWSRLVQPFLILVWSTV